MKLRRGDTLVVASHNQGKLREIRALLEPFGLDIRGAGELGLPEPEETGATFTANAELKARASALASGFHALSDDSGLAVIALDGAPGIYSARWAGPEKDFGMAMARIEKELREKKTQDFSAKFVCALSLAASDGATQSFEGEVHGHLTFPPRGEKGFGCDPIVIAEGMSETFGEIAPEAKHAMSHRAKAFAQFRKAVLE